MSPGRFVALLSLACLGCAPTLSVGAPCVVSSDCDPLSACLAGRCRTECVTSRDCPYPIACVHVGDGRTACRVAEDGACRADVDDCVPPLSCVGGACVEPCDDPNGCVVENACVERACVTPPATTIGECSPIGPSGCGGGDVCSRTGESFGCTPAPSAPTPVGMRCTTQSQCGAGASCVTGRCVRLCVPGSTSCGLGTKCHPGSDLFGELEGAAMGPPPPEGLGYCTERCDPLRIPSGCPEGTACSFAVPGSTPPYFYCRSLELPALEPDADCLSVDPDRCPEGTVCETEDGSGRQCRPFCDLDDPGSCPDGRACQPVAVPGARFGVCAFVR